MKHLVISLTILMFLLGCTHREKEIPAEVKQKVTELGSAASTELLTTLKSHLFEALQQGELVEAFEFCAVQAIPLTEEVNERLPEGVETKRISEKFRNPANAPDELDKQALTFFKQQLAEKGTLPDFFIQREGENIFRYYKPLQIQKPCLKCHGKRSQVDAKILSSLQENYPNDRAINYAEQDFRGAVRVRIILNQD